ncbi:hypothetical protein Bpfe_026328, partial [Biomphalaria pfeifferi]
VDLKTEFPNMTLSPVSCYIRPSWTNSGVEKGKETFYLPFKPIHHQAKAQTTPGNAPNLLGLASPCLLSNRK